MFIADKSGFDQNLKKYNDKLDTDSQFKPEDLYGVYFKVNGKLTNFKPLEERIMVQAEIII